MFWTTRVCLSVCFWSTYLNNWIWKIILQSTSATQSLSADESLHRYVTPLLDVIRTTTYLPWTIYSLCIQLCSSLSIILGWSAHRVYNPLKIKIVVFPQCRQRASIGTSFWEEGEEVLNVFLMLKNSCTSVAVYISVIFIVKLYYATQVLCWLVKIMDVVVKRPRQLFLCKMNVMESDS